MKAAGLCSITHTSGVAMLGSTAAGPSAAGTTGFIVGTVDRLLKSPRMIGGGFMLGVSAGSFEFECRTLADAEAALDGAGDPSKQGGRDRILAVLSYKSGQRE
jgi:hypothetical protein